MALKMIEDTTSALIRMNNMGVDYFERGKLLHANHMFRQALVQSQPLLHPSNSSNCNYVSSYFFHDDKYSNDKVRWHTHPINDTENPTYIDQSSNHHRPNLPSQPLSDQDKTTSGESSTFPIHGDETSNDPCHIYTSTWRISDTMAEQTWGSPPYVRVTRYIAVVVFNLAVTCHLLPHRELTDPSTSCGAMDACPDGLEATAGLYELTILLHTAHKDFFKLTCFSMMFLLALNNLGSIYCQLGDTSKAGACYSRLFTILTLLKEFDGFVATVDVTDHVDVTKDMLNEFYAEVVSILSLRRSCTAPSA